MTPEQMRDDMRYKAALSLANGMLEKGLITGEEYAEIDTRLLEKILPLSGQFVIRKRLLYPFFRVMDSRAQRRDDT